MNYTLAGNFENSMTSLLVTESTILASSKQWRTVENPSTRRATVWPSILAASIQKIVSPWLGSRGAEPFFKKRFISTFNRSHLARVAFNRHVGRTWNSSTIGFGGLRTKADSLSHTNQWPHLHPRSLSKAAIWITQFSAQKTFAPSDRHPVFSLFYWHEKVGRKPLRHEP